MKIKQKTKMLLMTLISVVLIVTASAVAVYATDAEPTGTEPPIVDGVYQIDSADDLIWFANQVNTVEGKNNISGKLMTDINLNPGYTFNADGSYTGGSAPSTWTPIGYYTSETDKLYIGTFDGNGKTVSGLYFNDNNKNNVGLFGYIGFVGEVKNVTVANSYINGLQNFGSVCGYNDGGTVTNCYNSGTVTVAMGNYVGGVCGYNDGGTVTNCSNTGTVSDASSVGGVCGYNNGGYITNCYNIGTVSGNDYVGGVCGWNNSGTITNCYNTGAVGGIFEVGGVCGENNGGITYCHNTGAVNGNSHTGGVCGYNMGINVTNCVITNCYNSGTVTVAMGNYVGGVCGKNNSGYITNCYNIGTVSGNDYVGGVCGYDHGIIVTNGVITNCYNSVKVTPKDWTKKNVGGVCGYSSRKIVNCYYLEEDETDTLDGTTYKTDTQFADTNGAVTNLLNGSVKPLVWYQGSEYPRIIPYRASESDPYEIYTADDLFWFAAYVNAGNNSISGKLMEDIDLNPGYTFTFIPDTGLVELKYGEEIKGYFGTGIKGESGGTDSAFDINASYEGVYYSTEYEATDAPNYLRTWTTIGNDFTTYTGNFDGNNHTVSGLYCNLTRANIGLFAFVGSNPEEIEGNITYIGGEISNIGVINSYICGGENVGGVCGYSTGGTITNCYNTGIVIGGNKVGGVCGWNENSSITNCYNTGAVKGNQYIGGVCGLNDSSSITNCYNTGTVNGSNYAGGVCGWNDSSSITNCYNTGAVNGNIQVGGVCGYNFNNASISSCYNTGAVYGDSEVGIMCGLNNATISNCYYLAESDNESDGKTASQFADGTVAWLLNTNGGENGYTHSGVWSQGESYPIFADETNKAIYKVGITGAVDKEYYRKSGENFTMPETIHVAGYTEPFTVTTDVAYTADAAITGVTPTVTDSVSFSYDVTVFKDFTPTLKVTIGTGSTKALTATASGEGDYLDYSFVLNGILPQQMTENIEAALMIGENEYATKSEYSVRTYVFNRLSSSTGSEEEKTFLVNMLYYGAEAQRYNGQTENFATDGLSAEMIANYHKSDDAWETITTATHSVKTVVNAGAEDPIIWKSATLVFDTTITMRLRFTTDKAAELSEAAFHVSFGNSVMAFSDAVPDPADETQKTYYIDIRNFTLTDYGTTVTAVLRDANNADVSGTATYSVMSYIANMKDNETMKDLVRALNDYSVSGVAYKQTVGS